MSGIRVTHLISGDLWAGAEAQTAALLGALHDHQDLQVNAILFNHGELESRLRASGLPVTVLEERTQSSVSLGRAVTYALRDSGTQILHTHRYKENVLGALASRRAGTIALVKTIHGRSEPFAGFRRIKANLYGSLDRWVTRRWFDRVICVSADMAREMERQLRQGVVWCIHNGIDLNGCHPVRSRDAVRNELHVDSDAPLLISAGRLVPVKGLEYLLEAVPIIRGSFPALRVLIVGEGPEHQRLQSRSLELGLSETVRFCGHRQDAYDLMAAADALVLPSLAEGLPMVILEAMALGTPIVASNVGGLPEVLTDGGSALLVPAGQSAALAQACIRMLLGRDEALALATSARQIVETRFTSRVQADRVASLYRSL